MTNRTLTHLNVARNGMGDAGARHIASMLRDNAVLRALELRGNGIAGPAAEEVRAAWSSRDQAALQVE